MAVEVALGTPLADALSGVVQPKLIEVGWTGEDDTSLAEYILLMLVNGKTQEQIAAELAQDLLPDGEGTMEFAQWLFDQVRRLRDENGRSQPVSVAAPPTATPGQSQQQAIPTVSDNAPQGDATMADVTSASADGNVPTGPKSMRGGRQAGRGGRMASNINKNLDRSNDSMLHRTRGQAGINTHSRTPRGPRGDQNRMMRPHVQQQLGAAMGMGGPNMQHNGGQDFMSAQQQMQFMAMMEEQARMMAQFMPGMLSGQMNQNFQGGQGGRPLSDRIESPNRGRGGRGRGGRKPHQNGHIKRDGEDTTMGEENNRLDGEPTSSMEVESSQTSKDPSNNVCRFNLKCTRVDCPYAHQSPAAPEGTSVDFSDVCSYGAACKNSKCTAKHPSPAQKTKHQAEEQCKFWPNCANPTCSFKHPTMPMCRNGADCDVPNCKFTHLQTTCRFNPCLNPKCPFKHADGQKQLKANVWTADSAAQKEDGHVSERKFVDDAAEEELVKPDASENMEDSVT